jgi:hypothetical protein
MFIPSYRIASRANREITPPLCLGAALRQPSFAAGRVELRERVNRPDQRAATATQNPKSTILRIYPMNPEPPPAPAQNLKSAFCRIYPMNPEPTAAIAQPQIHDSPNLPYEPRATHATRAKPQIRVLPNLPHEPRANRGIRTKPQIHFFTNQPYGLATAGDALPGTHDVPISADLRLPPIALRGSRTSLYNRQIASVGLLSTAEQRCAQAG